MATIEEVRSVIDELVTLPENVDREFKLESLNMDALDWAELAMALEEEFEKKVDVQVFDKFKTIGDIVSHFSV